MINFTLKTFINIGYHKPNENFFPEDYTYHMLHFHYTFLKESDLKLNNTCLLKINGPGVLNVVNRNGEILKQLLILWIIIGY